MSEMILKMSIATIIYIAVTALVWLIWKWRKHTLFQKILVGFFFGGCSIASTHIGINYGDALLNVRDIGPLAAGLFFSPLSGVIAGLLGGIERYIAGSGQFLSWTFEPIAPFTQVACSVSTCLAGFLAAFLNRCVYGGRRPPVSHSFFLGALMEVFHMYAVYITHRDSVSLASSVVSTCAVPMIIFTALGVAGCCFVVLLASGDRQYLRLRVPKSRLPLSTRFQRWMLAVTLVVFGINTFITHQLATRTADQESNISLRLLNQELVELYDEEKNFTVMKKTMDTMLLSTDVLTLYFVVDRETGVVVSGTFYAFGDDVIMDQTDMETIRAHLDAVPFKGTISFVNDVQGLCNCSVLGDRYYLLLFIPSDSLYYKRNNQMYENLLSDILLFTVLYILINLLVEYLVVRNLQKVNASLDRITHGKLEETVSVNSSREFTALSGDINKTVTALRGYIDAAEKRMEEELNLAKEIQASALPRVFEHNRHDFEIYALMTPARQVGGDFYDFFFIDTDVMALVIADVSGKGIPAALFMMRSKTAIKQYARSGYNPGQLLEEVNSILCEGNDAEMFVTVWIGIIDLKTGHMRCANAGHEYPVLMRSGGEYELMKDKHGLALAAMDGIHMRDYELQLNPGDRFFVYTDGVPEAINEKEEAYGTDRLIQALNRVRGESEETVLESTLSDLRAFVGEADQFDDITMLGFTYNGPAEK